MSNKNGFDVQSLAPKERIFMAAFRLQSAEMLLLEVIRLGEQTRSIFTTLTESVGGARSDRAFDTLKWTASSFELLQVARLWDRVDFAGYSLPTLVALLDDRHVIATLFDEIQLRITTGGDLGDVRRQAHERIVELQAAFTQVKAEASSSRMRRLRQWRDKHLAHPIFRTRAEREGAIHPVQWQEVRELVAVAMAALLKISFALKPQTESLEWPKLLEETARQSDDLFGSLRYASRER